MGNGHFSLRIKDILMNFGQIFGNSRMPRTFKENHGQHHIIVEAIKCVDEEKMGK